MKRIGAVLVIVSMLLACAVPVGASYDWTGESFFDDYYGVAPASSDDLSLYASAPSIEIAGTCQFSVPSLTIGGSPSSITKSVSFPIDTQGLPVYGTSLEYGSGLSFSGCILRPDSVSNFGSIGALYLSCFFQVPDGNSISYLKRSGFCSVNDFDSSMRLVKLYQPGSELVFDRQITTFTPSSGFDSVTTGYQYSFTFDPLLLNTSSYLTISNPLSSDSLVYVGTGATYPGGSEVDFCVSSFNCVGFSSEEEKADLEAIAKKLTETNAILTANFGEVVKLVKDLSETVDRIDYNLLVIGNKLTALTSKLESLNTSVSNIYSLLNTYLRYLQTIARTAEDIEAAIESFHSDFIAKINRIIQTTDNIDAELKAFNAAVQEKLDRILDALETEIPGTSDLENKNDAAQDSMGAYDEVEGQWTQNMTDSWSQLGVGDFQFDSGLINGFALLTGIFNDIWRIFGGYSLIFIFPLLLGIVLTAIGRLSRTGGSKGGGG